jgi:hypothetical protein
MTQAPFISPPVLVTLCVGTVIALFFSRPRKLASLPPGPRGWPIIGNTLQVPLHVRCFRLSTPRIPTARLDDARLTFQMLIIFLAYGNLFQAASFRLRRVGILERQRHSKIQSLFDMCFMSEPSIST